MSQALTLSPSLYQAKGTGPSTDGLDDVILKKALGPNSNVKNIGKPTLKISENSEKLKKKSNSNYDMIFKRTMIFWYLGPVMEWRTRLSTKGQSKDRSLLSSSLDLFYFLFFFAWLYRASLNAENVVEKVILTSNDLTLKLTPNDLT